jgi:hypothetical protein
MHAASADSGHVDCARLLLDAGADTNSTDNVRASRSAAGSVLRCNIFAWGDDDDQCLWME